MALFTHGRATAPVECKMGRSGGFAILEEQSMGNAQVWTRWLMLRALRPYLRNRLVDRGKWFLLNQLNPRPGPDEVLAKLGTRVCRMRGGGLIECDMRHSADRFVYLTGEYEIACTRFLRRVVGPGWRFVDVGANVGKVTVIGATLADHVIAIEPNTESRFQLERNLRLNGFSNVEVHAVGLSDVPGEALLFQTGLDSAGASLLKQGGDEVEREVSLSTGDSLVGPSSLRTYLKIDVEGFEEHVLRGFAGLLEQGNIVVQAEITDHWLRRAGGSAVSLFAFMCDLEYYAYTSHSRTRIRTRVELEPLEGPQDRSQYNAIFIRQKTSTAFWEWLASAT